MSSKLSDKIKGMIAEKAGGLDREDIEERKRMIEERLAREPKVEGAEGAPLPTTVEGLKADIERLNAEHTAALESIGDKLKSDLGERLTAIAHLEEIERQKNEKGMAGRLSDVLDAMKKHKEDDAILAAAGEDAEQKALKAEEDRLMARITPALAAADETYTALHKWASVYKPALDGLNRQDRTEFLKGAPSTTAAESNRSVGLAAQLEATVIRALALYQNMLETNSRCRQEVQSILRIGRFRMEPQELKRSLNQTLHELQMGMSPSNAEMLEAMTRDITATLEAIATRKLSVKGELQPEIEFEDKGKTVADNIEAERRTAAGTEYARPITAVTDDGHGHAIAGSN